MAEWVFSCLAFSINYKLKGNNFGTITHVHTTSTMYAMITINFQLGKPQKADSITGSATMCLHVPVYLIHLYNVHTVHTIL